MEVAVFILVISLVAVICLFIIALVNLFNLKKNTVNIDKDKKTGLLNRDGFMETGGKLLARLKDTSSFSTHALLIFDIEQFGKLVTLFGIEVGDGIVTGFARALEKVASGNSVIGRVDTDDFALLTRCSSQEDVNNIVKEFSKALEEQFSESSALMEQVDFFTGVCFFDEYDDIYTLFNKANLCLIMNEQKSRVVFFSEEMENRMVENELLRSEMLDALETGQFELYYQPKISFKNGEILGVEALIRWHHPTNGFIPPSEFIPLAEKTGIITKIDEWGLRTACHQCKAWQDKGLPPVKISVNMSQAQFYCTDVYGSITQVLEETGLDPKYLEIEVTETMAMKDIERTVNVLGKIRGLGVSVSMDDFGSGYSSLSSLKTIPLDILKIDRSLVCDIDENDVSQQITGAIVDLGKAMELEVLAEGVETVRQTEILRNIGCDLAQGYFYSKPRPADEIESLLIMPFNTVLEKHNQ